MNPRSLHSALAAAASLSCWLVTPAAAEERAAAERIVNARLICEETALVPGTTAHLGVLLEIAPEWHLFWDGCNDTGYPIAVDPQLPAGFHARPVEWPAPLRVLSEGNILDHIYEGRVLLILPVDVPADLRVGADVSLGARLEWVSCHDACEVGGDSVSIRLPVIAHDAAAKSGSNAAAARAKSESAPLFAETRTRVPWGAGGDAVEWTWNDDTLVVSAPSAKWMAFYPQGACESFVDIVSDGLKEASRLELRTRAVDGKRAPVRGVIEIRSEESGAPRWVQLSAPAPQARASSSTN